MCGSALIGLVRLFKVRLLLVNYVIALTRSLEQWICLFTIFQFHLFSDEGDVAKNGIKNNLDGVGRLLVPLKASVLQQFSD